MKASKRNNRTFMTNTKSPPIKQPEKPLKTKNNKKSKQNFMPMVITLTTIVLLAVVIAIVLSVGNKDVNSKPKTNNSSMNFNPKAKDFTLTDTDGKTHKLSDYAGQPVVLDFSASWCGPCRAQMPAIAKLYNEFKDQVQFFTVDHIQGNETVEKAFEFKSEEGIAWPLLLDKTGDVYGKYNISGIPAIMLLDQSGIVYHEQTGNKGDLMYTQFKEAVQRLMTGE